MSLFASGRSHRRSVSRVGIASLSIPDSFPHSVLSKYTLVPRPGEADTPAKGHLSARATALVRPPVSEGRSYAPPPLPRSLPHAVGLHVAHNPAGQPTTNADGWRRGRFGPRWLNPHAGGVSPAPSRSSFTLY